MKRIFITALVLCNVFAAYSQDIEKYILQKDSMRRELVAEKEKSDLLNKSVTELQKQVKELEKELDGVKKFREQKKVTDRQLQQKDESIAMLKSETDTIKAQLRSETDAIKAQLKTAVETGKQEAAAKYREGEQSAIAGILKNYQTGHFDDLIKNSTKLSVERDWELSVKVNDSVSKPVLSDLRKYFKAKELLEKKFDEKQINAVLPTLTRQSALSDKLKETLENYRDFTDGLKETIEKIISIDGKETVAGMGDEIQKEKLNKILAEISLYIFNYDFNFVDYPYLSDILLEIIKRKQPDADANISDLLNKIKY